MAISPEERELGTFLRDLPSDFENRYSEKAANRLRERLYRSLAGNNDSHLRLLFPRGPPLAGSKWSLRDAQGAVDGAEYTAAAKGHPCGHIFKTGESTYHCKTCAADDTCVLCAKCFQESDHDGHMVYITVSPGNSGCCDCADDEAWVRPVHCTIHSADDTPGLKAAGKTSQVPALPDEILHMVRMTIGKAFDYLCDVFSCSPEQLRLQKNEDTVKRDELLSRLTSDLYGGPEVMESDAEYALVLWNDEKHTVDDVRNQVAKACRKSKTFGLEKAMEVNDVGRSVVHYSKDVQELLRMASVIEQLKVTVTIRSARDTFREQMCDTIVDWVSDISGCSYGADPHVLRNTVCQELLRPWRMGSEAINAKIGQDGIDDHEHEDNVRERRANQRWFRPLTGMDIIRVDIEAGDDETDDDDGDDDGDDDDDEEAEMMINGILENSEELGLDEHMDVDDDGGNVIMIPGDNEMDLDLMDTEGPQENLEATIAGYPPPPLPPAARRGRVEQDNAPTPNESDEGEGYSLQAARSSRSTAPYSNLPKTPKVKAKVLRSSRPAKYWLETTEEYRNRQSLAPEEDLWQRVRLDYLILYDLRLWKTLRVSLRHLYISTVVTIPQFKRILGLRFAGLYTMLAQLYLIADREPDHSIINLSVQMLTTPSITAEVVERGNFLTNLMAILYTFLTTRQVGFAQDVNPSATLAFDAGAVTNRRMFHFFVDTRYMFQSAFVQDKVRTEPRYLLQFLDLAKLHQGICPNVRAIGEHVEYEADAWISASMIIKEINRLCRQVAESFKPTEDHDISSIQRAIRDVARVTYINSFGIEASRFRSAEIKTIQGFHQFQRRRRGDFIKSKGYEMMTVTGSYSIPKFEISKGAMSFHHPLHYLLSWLLEAGKSLDRLAVLNILNFSEGEFGKDPWNPNFRWAHPIGPYKPDEIVCMLFEFPLRVCAWLAQMRAGMWVRNGITLRHQMHTYRGTSQRDVSYQRDIFLLQAGFVLCGGEEESLGERFLAQILDRYDLGDWINGIYDLPEGYDEQQRLDVAEDFYHLLIVLLSERGNLIPGAGGPEQHIRALQRDIAHVLCFKPLSFSDISNRLTDRVADAEEFDSVLEDMTTFRSPEGLNDSGTFELKPEYIELVDPYYAYYNRNQREEAENIYKALIAKKTGRPKDDIVYEPQLAKITSGLFTHLSAFTQTSLFNDVVFWGLEFALRHHQDAQTTHLTRIETMLHVVLHLTLLAVLEDATPKGPTPMHTEDSFIRLAIFVSASETSPDATILGSLFRLLRAEGFASCAPKIRLILDRMSQKWPQDFAAAKSRLSPDSNRETTPSATGLTAEDKELKKKQALERQARVMASFKAQQTSFMEKQGLDFEADDFSDMEEDTDGGADRGPETKSWKFPSGSCMLCQEETNDDRLFGTFAFMAPSKILRQTPVNDTDFIQEVLDTPSSLDRSADAVRPFGVANTAREVVRKTAADGSTITQQRQGLSKGFPSHQCREGPVVTSCGHIMHFSCFEAYMVATQRRHAHQIARNHPERPESKEFLCPLCKALGNTFLPIIWKDKQYSFPSVLQADNTPFEAWLASNSLETTYEEIQQPGGSNPWRQAHMEYLQKALVPTLAITVPQLRRRSSPDDESDPEMPDLPEDTFETGSRSIFPDLLRRTVAELGFGTVARPQALEQPTTPSAELVIAYKRIEESMRPNKVIPSDTTQLEPGTQSSAVQQAEALCNALAFSISSIEISQRGVANPGTTENETLLDAISEQTMTTLRILSETVSSVTAMAATRASLQSGREAAAHRSWTNQLRQILGIEIKEDPGFARPTLFEEDIFVFFTKCTLNELPIGSDLHHLLRLCYSAEIIKVLWAYHGRRSLNSVSRSQPDEFRAEQHEWQPSLQQTLPRFQAWLIDNSIDVPYAVFSQQHGHGSVADLPYGTKWHGIMCGPYDRPVLERIIDRYALTFLRKAVILMHARFGVDFSAAGPMDPDLPELDRLAQLLRLPKPAAVFQMLSEDSSAGEKLRRLSVKWVQSATAKTLFKTLRSDAQALSHPAIFELVGLPKHYDTLTEEAIKRRCPTTGKEVSDPADGNKGGCYQHREKCGGNIGIFISIRKCMVLFLHNGHGSWYHAPYLDRHGEVDPTLRRHHQLFLNQRRYDKLLRDAWLSHGIPSVISRRLEGDMNTGGWETL
ncbi:hypothetical protein MBLNU459_g4437t1 [Dothideomycetes sp. NU459]